MRLLDSSSIGGAVTANMSGIAGCASPFGETQTTALRVVTLLGASLSTLGAFFIIFSYYWFPRLRTFPYRLIMFLSIADFFSSLSYFIGLVGEAPGSQCNSETGCIVSAVMTQFFDVATFFWTAIIGFTIFEIFVRQKGRQVESNESRYHMLAWGLPGFLAVIVGALGAYGDAGNWCWIKASEPSIRFFCYYLPLILIIIYNTVNFVLVGRSMRDESSSETAVIFRLRMYLVVFVVVRLPGLVDRIQNALTPNDPVFIFVLLHSLLSPLQGFANSLVYGCNRQVANEYKYCLAPHADRSPVNSHLSAPPPPRGAFGSTEEEEEEEENEDQSNGSIHIGGRGSGVTDIDLVPLTTVKARPGKDGIGDFEMIDLA